MAYIDIYSDLLCSSIQFNKLFSKIYLRLIPRHFIVFVVAVKKVQFQISHPDLLLLVNRYTLMPYLAILLNLFILLDKFITISL